MSRNAPAWIGLTALVAAACYFAATQALGGAEFASGDVTARFATAVGFLIVILGAAVLGIRSHVSVALRQLVTWLSAALAGAVIFAYRAEFHDVGGPVLADLLNLRVIAGDVARSATVSQTELGAVGGDQAVISAGRGGQFYVEAMIDGSHVQLVADTGATLVSLTAEDAMRIGFDHRELDFRYRQKTANGEARAAVVVLDEVAVGPVTVKNVRASVSEPGLLHVSLLGMSFLSQLSSFHIRGDQLVLRQ